MSRQHIHHWHIVRSVFRLPIVSTAPGQESGPDLACRDEENQLGEMLEDQLRARCPQGQGACIAQHGKCLVMASQMAGHGAGRDVASVGLGIATREGSVNG